ncbi:hypothetical protein [Paenibacillus sp. Marseille-Q4541]|uniref:hypothetical protein n=1 Tax=Paenibacillus sp. Marseille-Q4541 TaxID=2831522 RepID=UPI001BAB9CF1|nr:hypothetical protein [Paenibacillus sp. Marseille-Q4541]
MTKRFAIKEAWLLDNKGIKSLKMEQLDPNEAFEVHVDLERVRGNLGNITENIKKSK